MMPVDSIHGLYPLKESLLTPVGPDKTVPFT